MSQAQDYECRSHHVDEQEPRIPGSSTRSLYLETSVLEVCGAF
uniref:Rho GTPase activating protein 39 n=1 Tax=Mus musculus TaxID=10090 RepID=H3BKC8_MOUSE